MCVALFQRSFQDVFWFLRSREVALSTKFNYMEKQPDITMNMRQILVDWLVEVSEEYKLQTETLHLAVNYIDRYKKLFRRRDRLIMLFVKVPVLDVGAEIEIAVGGHGRDVHCFKVCNLRFQLCSPESFNLFQNELSYPKLSNTCS